MSDDLISREAVIDIIENVISEVGVDLTESLLKEARVRIEHLDTAFDKEKVIEELKSNMGSAQLAQSLAGTDLVQCGGFSYGYYNGVKDAVKIVEKGGLN